MAGRNRKAAPPEPTTGRACAVTGCPREPTRGKVCEIHWQTHRGLADGG
jgi:hypothetical protein